MERFNYTTRMFPPYVGKIGTHESDRDVADYQAMIQRELQGLCNNGLELVGIWPQPSGWALFVFRDKNDWLHASVGV